MEKLFNYRFITILFFLLFFLGFKESKAQDWEMLWSYNISSQAGDYQAGAETDGTFLYTAFWQYGDFAKYDLDGNLIETFAIPGIDRIKDLTFDGEYFYGSNTDNSGEIFIMDFSSQSLVGTITVAGTRIRHIAYDSDQDKFWCGNWQSDIICVDRGGNITNTIPFSTHRMTGLFGSAYDNISEGGPYLWVHSQSCYGSDAGIAQISLATGAPTGLWHNVKEDFESDVYNPVAGGLFSSLDLMPGYLILGGVVQGEPNTFFAYSLMQYGMIPPDLVAPENAEFGTDVLTFFQWTAASGVNSYNIQISLYNNFNETVLDITGINTLSYQIAEGDRLEETTKYFWRVRGQTAGGEYTAWSKKFSFVTGGDLPQATLLTPSNGAGGIVANPLMSWEKHIAASNYRLQIASDEDFSDLIVDDESLTESKYIPSALEMVTQYWWRVKMFNDFSESDWSEVFTFTTGSFFYIGEETDFNDQWGYPTGYGNWYGGCKQQFLIPSEELFEAGASPGFLTSLGFNVAMVNVGTPLQNYEIKLKLTSAEDLDGPWELDGFTSVYLSNAYVPVLGWNVHEFTAPFFWDGASNVLVDICFNNLSYTYNESCYWSYCDYVATRYFQNDYDPNVCTNPQWVNINYMRPNMQFSLEQAAIMPPALEDPANNSVCVITEPLLQWGPVEGANSYALQIAEDPDFYGLVLEEAGITSNDYLVPAALNELSKYYWRVNATDGEVTSFWSQKWSFITEGDLPEPLLVYPSNYETEQNPTLVLSWEEIVGAQLYTVQLSKDEDFETVYREVFAYSNQITVQNLDLNTQFWWRVQAENECSESPFSEAWTFSTSNVPFAYGYNNWWTDNMLPGPVMFALNDPQNMFVIDEQQDYDNVYAGAWADGSWYAATPWSQEFFSFNLETGERNYIGTLSVEFRGISYDEQTSTMYGLSYGNSALFTIDLESAEIELVGELGMVDCFGLACSVDGDLYTICPVDDNLYMIDKYTGIPTLIGPLGYNAEYEQDLEFDKANNVLYWAGYVDYMGYLFTIDVESGAATMVGSFPDYLMLTSLAIPFSPACLAFPALAEPIDKSVCNSLTPNFAWETVENALYYNFELSTNRDFSDIIYSEQELDAPYILLPESVTLDYLTPYYWRVQAFGEDDCISYWSSRWSFVTEGELPQAVLLSPVNGAEDGMVSPMFSWQSNPGASFYNLQIAADEDFEGIIVDLPYLTTSRYSGAELSTNTQYWWKVKMTNDCSEGDWSEVFTFTTGSSIVVGEGTYQDEWLGPYNLREYGSMNHYLVLASELIDAGAIEGALTSLSFNVASVFGDAAAREFTISMKHTAVSDLQGSWDFDNFTTVFGPEDYTPSLGWNTHYFDNPFIWDGVSNVLIFVCFNNLNESNNAPMMYCHETNELLFRMHSESGNPNLCAMDYINWWSGTWMRPNMRFGIDLTGFFPPQLSSPEHKSICNPVSPLFTWEGLDAESYIFQLGSDPDFAMPLYQESDIENVEFQLPESVELNNNEMYYWRVRSFDGENVSFWSKTFNFITEGETLPTPTLISPDDGAEDCLSSLNFVWTGHIAASSYHLQLATDENFENLVVDDASLTQSSCPIRALALNTQFFWRVMMLSPCSENIWSETRTFTTGSYFLAGDGTQYNGQWDYPAAYGNADPSAKQQYLILAEELFDSGISEGALHSIAFNVAQINSGQTLQGYTISLKNTSISQFDYSDWILSGWNLVYGPVDYTPTLGWNTHEFEEAFVWDGVSNILVDICYNNWNWSSANEGTYWTQTPFNSSCYYRGWEDDLTCTDPQWMNVWNMRPNMAFGIGGTGPEQPILIAPSNNAYNVDLSPLLEWSDVEGAVLYNLQIAENSNFYPLVSEQEIFSGTSYQVPAGTLSEASLYYWRVNTSDGENVGRWSNVWKFSTITPTPTLLSPVNGANGVPLVTEFIWEDILPDYYYQIQAAYDSDFGDMFINEISSASSIVYEFGYNETCYWRVRVNSNGILSDWSEVWTFTTQLEIPWEYDETNVYADIIVPAAINPMIGDRPIAEGDAVGLFYEKEPGGDWYCAGYGAWDGSNLGIRVWGDDPSTPEKEGYADNETFVFKIWDAALSREWDAIATYQLGNDYFEPNGFSMLSSLVVSSSDMMELSLASGWSIISSYIAPQDADIEEMFAPVVNNLRVMKDADGQMYDPEFGLNSIGDWINTSAYLINMSSSDILNITGTKIYPENSPIDLFSGWNLSAYLRDNSISPALALANIENNLFLAKNNAGGLYIPIYGVNSLAYMQPGEGYYLYMNENALLTYPDNSAQKSDLGFITPSPKHLIPQCAKSGNNATLILRIEGKEGNEIGVYNESNMLIGSAVVSNGIAAITVWGKDMLDENSFGAKEAEFISAKLFDIESKSCKDITLMAIQEITSNISGESIRYKANSIYLAKAAISEDLGYGAFIRNIPNPAASSTLFEFNLPSEGSAEIQIYSSTGELVANFARNQYSAGLHKANFDVSNLASGIYNVVLSFGESRVSSFMIINKQYLFIQNKKAQTKNRLGFIYFFKS